MMILKHFPLNELNLPQNEVLGKEKFDIFVGKRKLFFFSLSQDTGQGEESFFLAK